MNNKKIYIVLSFTGTAPATLIRMFTRKKYSHSSIALDKELNEMYSFGRLNPYNPFKGGFVHEGIYRGTFNRFKKTKAKVLEIDVTEEDYNRISDEIASFKNGKWKYNYLGVLLYPLKKAIRFKNRFYCSEFVKHLLDLTNVDFALPEVVEPYDFNSIEKSNVIYEGILRKY